MEDWEKKRREQLNKEVSEGLYYIGEDPIVTTGKKGYIEFQIALEKEAKEFEQVRLLSHNSLVKNMELEALTKYRMNGDILLY
jgi:hypothetical protein